MNILAFPFYSSVDKQARNSACSSAALGALVAPANRWLPFMITLPPTGEGLDCINIYDAETDAVALYVLPDKFAFDVFSNGINDFVFYYGGLVIGLNLTCGKRYYLEAKGQFSEVFQVVDDLSKYLKLEWKHKLPVQNVIYQTGFINRLYLDAVISEPTFKYDIQGEEDGYGVFQPTRSRVDKIMKFDTQYLPEFLVDALSAVPLHSSVNFGRFTDCRDIKTSLDQSKDGCSAIVQVTFSNGIPVEADYCGNPAPIAAVDLTNYLPKTWLCDGGPNRSPDWVNANVPETCELVNNRQTGWLVQQQFDQNPASASYGQTRNVRTVYNTAACALPPVFRSGSIVEQVQRNDCGPGYVGGFVTYALPEGHIIDMTSQLDVDTRARAYFDSTKQGVANSGTGCNVDTTPTGPVTCDTDFDGCFEGTVNAGRPATASECAYCLSIVLPAPDSRCSQIVC